MPEQIPVISKRKLPTGSRLDEALRTYKEDLVKDAANTWDQRDSANEDMRFMYVDGGMWEDYYMDDYCDGRAKPQVNLIAPHVNKFQGEWNTNRMGVEYRANDEKGSPKEANLLNGIFRNAFRQFGGPEATDNAVNEQSVAGYGALSMLTRYADEEDPENENQDIIFEPIDNAFNTCIWDRTAKRLTKSDARRVTRLYPYDRDDFVEMYPDISPSSVFDPRTWSAYNWNSYHDYSRDIIYVAKRYEIFKVRQMVYVYLDLRDGSKKIFNEEDHKNKEAELKRDRNIEFVRKRPKICREVWCSYFTADTFIEKPRRLIGKHLPIIPFYGYRGFVDSQEYYRGLVREGKDTNRLFNMIIGKLAENSASAGTSTKLFHPDQMDGAIGAAWQNTVNKNWLPVGEFTDSNGDSHVGPLGEINPEQLDQSTVTLLNQIPEIMKVITSDMPQDILDPNTSGKALNAMIKRINMNTQPMMDNIASAIEWMGVVFQGMAQEVYTDERVVNTLGKDGAEGMIRLRETTMDEESGQLIEQNDLRDKKFQAYADVGDQYETNREASAETLKDVLQLPVMQTQAGAQYLPAILASLFQTISGEGLEPLNKISRRSLITQGLIDPETDEEKQMVAQLKQQQGQPNPQDKLMESVAQKEMAEARSLDAGATEKAVAAKLKQAQILKTFSDIEVDQSKKMNERAKTATDIKKEQRETLAALEENALKSAESFPVVA